jgi:hypothetical protein
MRQVVKAGIKKGVAAAKKVAGKADPTGNDPKAGALVVGSKAALVGTAVGVGKYQAGKEKRAKGAMKPRGGKPMKGSK